MSRPGDRRPIVVGIDPDPSRRMALAWAADEAARRRLPLRPVHVEGVPTRGYRGQEIPPSWEEWNEALHRAGKQVLEEAADFVTARHPQVEVDTVLAEGDPVWVLREQSRDATAVVLGSRHLSRTQEVFGSASVALPVMAHSHCPVVVVPEPEHVTQEPAYYVVGVDGSEHSAAAVDVAFEEAALRGAEVRALYVWEPGPLRIFDEYAPQQEARRLLSETVAGRQARYPEVDLRHELLVGHPVQVLTDASAHALGLVVGTRGHGGFTGMLLGSVSQGVLHHARCPVIAVPSRPT
ncbi:universal stress protein [Streptomyces mirabilis]|jgi:nucleotide-binding universal stress UspA family protein|uniref:Nucleotide-binding universal stress protein, UspA family n=1 Tax=Streptomyces mirabilis TaxID=68239 RepID=A0A1I2UA19_9ACTN|nr:universal stress protein [Streptomyces mirabilis]SFG73229.1 Nucleotide-binding universal stress protein, UspA family [Streptomyces mirabilis]